MKEPARTHSQSSSQEQCTVVTATLIIQTAVLLPAGESTQDA